MKERDTGSEREREGERAKYSLLLYYSYILKLKVRQFSDLVYEKPRKSDN